MIETLHISNYALIDNIDIAFKPGFNVITGETGAGKSIIMGALSMLLGGRADSKAVRRSDSKSVIEAMFSVAAYPSIKTFCRENDIEGDDTDMCILRREILPTGRSRAFINDTPVNIATLQAVAAQLVDIHSQHQNLQLASPPYQLQVIDSLVGDRALTERYAKLYVDYRQALHRYKALKREMISSKNDEEYMRYQLSLLDELKLEPGEQDDLEKERELMANLTEVKASLTAINDDFSNGSTSILSLLKNIETNTAEIVQLVDDAPQLLERIEALRIEARDLAETFSEIDRDINADPGRLEEVEQRLNDIYDLQRKHHVDTVEALIEIREQLRRQLDNVDNADERIQRLEENAKRAKRAALECARKLSDARSAAAVRFAEELKNRAVPLGMKNLRCQVSITQGELTPTGIDSIEFLFAFNKNQPLMPVGGTASGGEISRLMLSLKSIVADKMQMPSIIFDEVDTGVSGDVAARMGRMMSHIAENIQVIAITHLPQVAALASSQYKVYKEDTDEATATRIVALTLDDRVEQIAAMLSGDHVDDAARANARSLLGFNTNSSN